MCCENHFCVYQTDGICTLDKIHLDITGSCTDCIYIELNEAMLAEIKQEFFRFSERKEG